jgi:hypothetical protein
MVEPIVFVMVVYENGRVASGIGAMPKLDFIANANRDQFGGLALFSVVVTLTEDEFYSFVECVLGSEELLGPFFYLFGTGKGKVELKGAVALRASTRTARCRFGRASLIRYLGGNNDACSQKPPP